MTKQILRSLILIFLLLPSSAYAFLSIEIFSIGILSVNIEIPFVAALLGAGIASIFGGFFSSVSYGYAPPPIIEQKHTLSVTIGEPRKKEV